MRLFMTMVLMTMVGEPGAGAGGGTPSPPNGAPAPTPQATAPTPAPTPVQPTPQATPQAAPVTPTATPVTRTPTRKLLDANTDDIDTAADLLEMPPKAFQARMDRYSKKQLRELFGTDDTNKIRENLQRLNEYDQQAEQQRQAALTAEQRLNEQLAAERQRAEAAEMELESLRTQQIVSEQDVRVMGLLGQHINPRYAPYEAKRLADYINTLSEAELADADAIIVGWCKEQIKQFPELAKAGITPDANPTGGAVAGTPTTVVTPPGQPFSNGAGVTRPDQASEANPTAAKTFAPNQPNSMSPKEWSEYKRKNGWNF